MALCTIWKEYQDNQNHEVEKRLCNRIGQLSEIVLFWLNIGKDRDFYEDLKQYGYVCFFEIVKGYNPERDALEGLFMQAFKNDVIDYLNRRNYHLSFDTTRIPDEGGTPVQIAEANDLDFKLQQQLTNKEWWVYILFLKQGVVDEKEITEFFNGDKTEVAYLLDSIRRKYALLGETE